MSHISLSLLLPRHLGRHLGGGMICHVSTEVGDYKLYMSLSWPYIPVSATRLT